MSGVKIAKFGAVQDFTHQDFTNQAFTNQDSGLHMANLVAYLRRAFPASTAKQVAHVTGIPVSTLDKMLRGENKPSGPHFAMLCAVFGPGFVAACVPAATWAREVATNADFKRDMSKLLESIIEGQARNAA